MKDLIFNELTEQPLAPDLTTAIVRIEQFLKTYNARPADLFNKGVRLDKHFGELSLTEELSIQDLIFSNSRGRTLGNTILSLGRFPYLQEGSDEEDQYLRDRYFFVQGENRREVIGLAAAFLQNTVSIGFDSEQCWQTCKHSMIIESDSQQDSCVEVLSVSSPDHFLSEPLLQWIENNAEVELNQSQPTPEEKPIHLRDDHGTDILLPFARKLLRNCYVEGIVNSCEFSSYNRQFIRSVKENGIVEITLSWTDQGLGLAIQTTGRNRRETQIIAELLQEEFSRSR